ncbi:hypothetical protein Leryth_014013 [Lithospermum erythrorhizon]|nr:hypothetical protein Leryth_014013 [Lithospermum erythrorhizon]
MSRFLLKNDNLLAHVRERVVLLAYILEVTSPGGNVVHNLKGTSGDKFELKVPRSGMYKFCFHNTYYTPDTVSFYIHVGHSTTLATIAELREALESVTSDQKYLKARESRHRHTNESTRKRVI